MGYLSGSSPHIKSGAVSVLSLLIYKDTDICLSMPDLVPSLLSLLHGKSVEVIKVGTFLLISREYAIFCLVLMMVPILIELIVIHVTGCFGLCESVSVFLTS